MSEKEIWVLEYLKNKPMLKFIDMLDEDFVDSYIEKFNPQSSSMVIGSSKCKELSKLLGSMYKKGLLKRFPHGVKGGYSQDHLDFKAPKWVYSYKLP